MEQTDSFKKYAEEVLHTMEGAIYWEHFEVNYSDELRHLAIIHIQGQIDAIQGLTNTDTLEIFYNKALEYLKQNYEGNKNM